MDHAEKILAGLAALRDEDTLCDVELSTEQQTISAHRNVLATASPYFKAMFSGKFRETRSKVVPMHGVTAAGLKAIVEYIYTAKIEITDENVEEILPAAHLMQMNDIVEKCANWMTDKMTEINCFSLLKMAEKYNIQSVESAVHDFVVGNFAYISETKDFCRISQSVLCKYLSSDTLNTNMDEFVAFKAAKKWIEKNKITDEKVVTGILENVRFANVELDKLSDDILCDGMIANNTNCLKMIGEAMKYHGNSNKQPLYEGNLNQPRGVPSVLLISNGSLVNKQSFATESESEPVYLLKFPIFFRSRNISDVSLEKPIVFDSLSSIQVGNFIFVFGTNNEGFQNFTKRYNASNDTWMEMVPVPRDPVIGYAAAYVEGKIYLLGGMLVTRKTKYGVVSKIITNKVFVYDIASNTWCEGIKMPLRLLYPAAATLHGIIYVTGGYFCTSDNDEATTGKKVCAFDKQANLWLIKPPMNFPRCQHVLEAVEDKLYAIAGRDELANSTSVEVYDPQTNQWSVLQHNVLVEFGASSFVHGHNIFIVGGTEACEDIKVYNVEEKKLCTLEGILPDSAISVRNVTALVISPRLL